MPVHLDSAYPTRRSTASRVFTQAEANALVSAIQIAQAEYARRGNTEAHNILNALYNDWTPAS